MHNSIAIQFHCLKRGKLGKGEAPCTSSVVSALLLTQVADSVDQLVKAPV